METLNADSKRIFRDLPQEQDITSQQIGGYTQPSFDKRLQSLASKNNCKYIFSTSTITPLLSHLYYCISSFRTPHFDNLSIEFNREPFKFMISQRKPNTVFLRRIKGKRGNVYSIDGDAIYSEPGNLVLLKLGKFLERMLCTKASMITKRSTDSGYNFLEPPPPDFYRYSRINSILVRSQIDCAGEDEHGRPIVFEVKTRASAPVRYDILNYRDYLDYHLKMAKGFKESFEREFYDLIRGAFLKYCLQMRIGRMQGAFIAFHNTKQIDGFQYLPLEDLELRLFGCLNFAETVYKAVFCMLQKILDHLIEDLQSEFKDEEGDYVRLGFYANQREHLLNVYVQILDEQSLKKARQGEALIANIDDGPIDVYLRNKVQTKVIKYLVQITPILNGVISSNFPLLFETGDHLQLKYQIQKYGFIEFDQYMSFLHEAFKSQEFNILSPFQGSWRFVY